MNVRTGVREGPRASVRVGVNPALGDETPLWSTDAAVWSGRLGFALTTGHILDTGVSPATTPVLDLVGSGNDIDAVTGSTFDFAAAWPGDGGGTMFQFTAGSSNVKTTTTAFWAPGTGAWCILGASTREFSATGNRTMYGMGGAGEGLRSLERNVSGGDNYQQFGGEDTGGTYYGARLDALPQSGANYWCVSRTAPTLIEVWMRNQGDLGTVYHAQIAIDSADTFNGAGPLEIGFVTAWAQCYNGIKALFYAQGASAIGSADVLDAAFRHTRVGSVVEA